MSRRPDLGVLVQRGVRLLQQNTPKDGSAYYGAFSGGKDSCCIKELARMAEVPVEWHYHVTTIDPPELVRFIRAEHPDVIFDRPAHGNLLRRAVEIGVIPSRRSRWCCREYKETSDTGGRPLIVGVRAAESRARAERWTACVQQHDRTGGTVVLPVRLWGDDDVWQFVRWSGIRCCSLYDEGFSRMGCVGCPLASPAARRREFRRWPRYEQAWRRTFERIWQTRCAESSLFGSPVEWFEWWNDGQGNLSEWREAGDRAHEMQL